MTYWEKKALLGTVARGAGGALARGTGNFAKGLVGAGPMSGARFGGRAANWAGKATSVVAPVAASMSAGEGASFLGMGGKKVQASLTGSHVLDRVAVKMARMSAGDLIDAASYGSFLGAKFVDPHTHPKLHTALDAAGLLGLGATTAHSMLTNPADRAPSIKDLAGLALMGSALYDRSKAH